MLLAVVLLAGSQGLVCGKEDEVDLRLAKLTERFRTLVRNSPGIPSAAKRLDLLRAVAALQTEKADQFLADVARDKRHADILGEVLVLLTGSVTDSGIATAVLRRHMEEADPYRRLARDFLLERAVRAGDDQWLLMTFQHGPMEDRFLALVGMGRIKSPNTLRCAWELLLDQEWDADEGTVMTCGTIAHAVSAFEGTSAARLLMLMERDRRFVSADQSELRDTTRLWATGDLRRYVKISDLARGATDRVESVRFMGDAGIEAARAPLLSLARNRFEASSVRAEAAHALGGLKIARGELVQHLTALLTDADADVRRGAVFGLSRLKVRQATKALVALLGTHLEEAAREALALSYSLPAETNWITWLPGTQKSLPEGT